MTTNRKEFEGISKIIIFIILIALIIFNVIYNSLLIFIQPHIFWSVNMLFVLAMIPVLYPLRSNTKKDKDKVFFVIDVIMIIMAIVIGLYAIFEFQHIELRGGITTTRLDVLIFISTIFLVIENTRRVIGNALPILAIIFLFYGLSIFSIKRLGSAIFSMSGIFGTAFYVTISWIFVFMLFGSFLNIVGVGGFIIDLANSISGRSRGGPAKVAVIASALFGTISGSAVANVSGTGVFTIPMMKKLNFEPKFAGAVEAVASTGGQIMPPIMGAAVFLMAEIIGIPYVQICKAAFIPALLYFYTVWISIDLYARKYNLKSLKKEEIVNFKVLMKGRAYLIIPVLILIYLLFITKIHPITAALWSTLLTIILGLIGVTVRKKEKIAFICKNIYEELESMAVQLLSIMIAAACVGIILAVLNLSGLGLIFGSYMISLSKNVTLFGNIFILPLFLGMLVAIVFGMGLPTTVSYLICAAVIAPPLIELGLPVLNSHMFIFYFAILSAITPPVAMAAYTGATIAKAGFMETAIMSMLLGFTAFLLPFDFVMHDLLFMRGDIINILIHVILIIMGIYSISISIMGWFLTEISLIERIILFISGLILFLNNFFSFYFVISAAILLIGFSIFNYYKYKKSKVFSSQMY